MAGEGMVPALTPETLECLSTDSLRAAASTEESFRPDALVEDSLRAEALTLEEARRLGHNYRVARKAAEILSQSDFAPQCFHKVLPPRQYPLYEVSIWSDIGKN